MESQKLMEIMDKRREHKSLSVIGGIFGCVHSGLVMAAEAVNCLEASITEKVTKGDISYQDHKKYRDFKSLYHTENTKEKLVSFSDKIKEAKSKGFTYKPSVNARIISHESNQ